MTSVADPIRLGLIGLGRWGKNYARTIAELDGVALSAIATRSALPTGFDGIAHSTDWRDLCGQVPALDGVIIASDPALHFQMASSFLAQGIPVIVEKPACDTVAEAEQLRALSQAGGVLCMVGYTHLYASAYRALKTKVAAAGAIQAMSSVGHSAGPFRDKVSVLWDWGSHDVALCLDCLGEAPVDIQITVEETDPSRANAALYELTLTFPSGVRSVSRFGNIATAKERSFTVQCETDRFCYDGLDHVLKSGSGPSGWAAQDPLGPLPLVNLVGDFTDRLRRGIRSHQSVDLAVEVTRVLSMADQTLNH
ncbi:MAG: Gfo/Idh/MocA family protein [Rhodospirillaceae bacterium]